MFNLISSSIIGQKKEQAVFNAMTVIISNAIRNFWGFRKTLKLNNQCDIDNCITCICIIVLHVKDMYWNKGTIELKVKMY